MRFIESHELLRLTLFVVFVVFLDFLNMRLDFHEKRLRFQPFMEEREKNEADKNGKQDNRNPEVLKRNGLVKKHERVKERAVENFVK